MAILKLTVAAVVLVMVAASANSEPLGHFLTRRAILLDDNFAPVAPVADPVARARGESALLLDRHRRDSGYAPAPIHKGSYKKGKVGPVYTFVKTDYNGNFKWGVRHRAGTRYAGGYH